MEHVDSDEGQKSADPNEEVDPEHFLDVRHWVRHLEQVGVDHIVERLASLV